MVHSSDTLPSPVPEKAFVAFTRNGNEVGKTESSICTGEEQTVVADWRLLGRGLAGKGNAIWNDPIRFKVTMYTDDDNTFKEKRLAIKIKASTPLIRAQFPVVEPHVSACSRGLSQEPRKDKTVAKGEVDLSPLLSTDGSVKKAATHLKYRL